MTPSLICKEAADWLAPRLALSLTGSGEACVMDAPAVYICFIRYILSHTHDRQFLFVPLDSAVNAELSMVGEKSQ